MKAVRIHRYGDVGKLRVIIDQEYPLAHTKAAHQRSQSGRARGKIILRVG